MSLATELRAALDDLEGELRAQRIEVTKVKIVLQTGATKTEDGLLKLIVLDAGGKAEDSQLATTSFTFSPKAKDNKMVLTPRMRTLSNAIRVAVRNAEPSQAALGIPLAEFACKLDFVLKRTQSGGLGLSLPPFDFKLSKKAERSAMHSVEVTFVAAEK